MRSTLRDEPSSPEPPKAEIDETLRNSYFTPAPTSKILHKNPNPNYSPVHIGCRNLCYLLRRKIGERMPRIEAALYCLAFRLFPPRSVAKAIRKT